MSLVINSCPPQKISFESEVENVYMCVFKVFPFRERVFKENNEKHSFYLKYIS